MNWTKISPDVRPKAREASSYCTTPTGVYLFGGAIHDAKIPVPIESAELWKFDFNTETFEEIKVSGSKPCSRANSSLTHCSGKLYLFGGITEKLGWISDLWCFDIETASWKEIVGDAGGVLPANRCMHTLTAVKYNDIDHLILFGGFGPESAEADWEDVDEGGDEINQLQKQQEALILARYNDMYLFNTKTGSWQFLHNDIVPEKRCAHRLIYDSSSDSCILFGGKGDGSRLGDIWEFSLKTLSWKPLPSVGAIAPRSFHEMCGSNEGDFYIHGGRDMFNNHLSDIFQLTVSKSNENGLTNSKLDCSIAVGNHMFFSKFQDRFYIFGGSSEFDAEYGECKVFSNELWCGRSESKKAKMDDE